MVGLIQNSKRIFTTFGIFLLFCSISKCVADEAKVITDDEDTLKNPLYDARTNVKDTTPTSQDNHNVTGNHSGGHDNEHHRSGHYHRSEALKVASLNYASIRDPFIFTAVLILAGICKIVYHHSGFLSSRVPESCILIILGIIFGAIIHFSGAQETFPTFFKPHEFFVFLLPPIILEAAFSLHDRAFIENIGSIILFAVVGTILACVFMGLSLFGLSKCGAMGPIEEMGFVELMVFASLIVAVDPVAVLAVFNEIGVNQVLYFLVFGESLLNDGVTVVLYKVFQSYNVMDEITGVHILLGVVKFFVVCLGGMLLGVLTGVGAAIMTKYSTHVKVAQPLIIYTMAYLGFLLAEMFEFSGIISIVACGITLKQYAFNNISEKSRTTIDYFTRVISTACETIIFMFLGLSLVTDNHVWHTGFTLWTVVLCDVFRFLITFSLSFLINKLDIYRVRKISLDEQFMIAYGGLRGAVCFSLVALLNPEEFPRKDMFVTTTLTVVMFTVFVQGITIKPLVYLFRITLAPEKSKSMYRELHDHVTDHLMAGVEDIIGDHGKNHLREKLTSLDQQYVKPLLQVNPDPCDTQLMEFYNNLVLKEHYKHLKMSNVRHVEEAPKLPHVATELFLRGVLHAPGSDDPSADVTPMPKVKVVSQASKASKDGEVTLRTHDTGQQGSNTSRFSGLLKRSRSSMTSETINSHGLRALLSQTTNSHTTKFDRNLTGTKVDFSAEVSKKFGKNRRMQGLSSLVGCTRPGFIPQLSWSETNTNECQQRRDELVKENRSAPRHAATMDLPNHGRQGTVDPFDGTTSPVSSTIAADVNMSSMLVPPYVLDSLHEEDEEEKDHTSDDELLGEAESEEARMKRSDRRSTKHRLERQGGMDTQMIEPNVLDGSEGVALTNLNNDEVTVEVDGKVEGSDASQV